VLQRYIRHSSCSPTTIATRRCATPFGIDIVGITELVALVGATVGGLAARQRKLEAERLNEQLRKINMQLRQQARAGTIYAPGLSYAPQSSTMTVQTAGGNNADGSGGGAGGAAAGATATLTKPAAADAGALSSAEQAVFAGVKQGNAMSTMDEEISPEQQSCRETMREGKRLLRNGQGARPLRCARARCALRTQLPAPKALLVM
jgi:hypothetical protein